MPGPSALAGLELRIASQLRKTSWKAILAALFGRGAGLAVSALATAALSVFALVPFVVGREVDGFALFAVAGTLFVCAAAAKARGFKNVVKRIFEALLVVLVIAAAIALAIGQVGAIELSEIVRVQGALPWQLEATRHPACALLALVYFGAVVTLLRRRGGSEPTLAPASGGSRLQEAADVTLSRAAVLFASALGVAVFFGGWQLGGTLGFVLKIWLATAVCFGLRKVAVGLDPAELRRIVVPEIAPRAPPERRAGGRVTSNRPQRRGRNGDWRDARGAGRPVFRANRREGAFCDRSTRAARKSLYLKG